MSTKKRNIRKYAVQFKTNKRIQELEDQLVALQSEVDKSSWQATSVTLDNVGLEAKLEELQGLYDSVTESYEDSQVAVELLQVQLQDTKDQLATSIRACDAFSDDADRYYRMYEGAQEVADRQAIAFYDWKDKMRKQMTYGIPLAFAAGGILGLVSMYFQVVIR